MTYFNSQLNNDSKLIERKLIEKKLWQGHELHHRSQLSSTKRDYTLEQE